MTCPGGSSSRHSCRLAFQWYDTCLDRHHSNLTALLSVIQWRGMLLHTLRLRAGSVRSWGRLVQQSFILRLQKGALSYPQCIRKLRYVVAVHARSAMEDIPPRELSS